MLACEDRASIFCARVMRGTSSLAIGAFINTLPVLGLLAAGDEVGVHVVRLYEDDAAQARHVAEASHGQVAVRPRVTGDGGRAGSGDDLHVELGVTHARDA